MIGGSLNRQYYSDEDYEAYGEGDYGIEETINLLMRYEEKMNEI